MHFIDNRYAASVSEPYDVFSPPELPLPGPAQCALCL